MKSNIIFAKAILQRQSSQGFTLVELLMAMLISTLVVGGAGYGLIQVMQRNATIEAETLQRATYNRALDFITNEIRSARSIQAISHGIRITRPDNTTVTYTYQDTGIPSLLAYQNTGVIVRVGNSGTSQYVVNRIATRIHTCPSGTIQTGTGGFYACIQDSRRATIHLYGSAISEPISTRVFVRGAP